MLHTKELEGNSQQKRLTIPETSSEEPLGHSEIANSNFFLILISAPKNKNNPNQNQNKDLDPTLDFHESDKESENFVRKSKMQLFKNPLQKKWNGIAPTDRNHARWPNKTRRAFHSSNP